MKIAFVYPDLLDHRMDWPGYFYVGIATLSAVLKRQSVLLDLRQQGQPRQSRDGRY